MASVDWVIIGSDNGLSPVRHQRIISTNADLLSIDSLGTDLVKYKSKVSEENTFENVVCKNCGFIFHDFLGWYKRVRRV